MPSRFKAVLASLGLLSTLLVTGAPQASAQTPAPVISEIMYDSGSAEDDWEWVEIHNPGTGPIDLTGWVFDDFNGIAHLGANIAGGSVPAGGSAVLFNEDDLDAANFEAAWGEGINLVPVTNWGAGTLNNGGDTVGLWSSFADYDGDHITQANAVVSVTYPDLVTQGPSIHLTDLADQDSWAASVDQAATPVGDTYLSANAGGNNGGDVGSPGGTFPPPELLFTQYVEGGGNNKAIELANLNADPISLDGYVLELYSNGSTTVSTSTDLTGFGTVAPNDVFVLYNSQAAADLVALGDATAGAVNWNGDDAIVLRNPALSIADSFGKVGEDPGNFWESNGVRTQNRTLCRLDSITAGDTDPTDDFFPGLEWTSLPQDDFTGLGEIGCDAPPPVAVVLIHEIQGPGAVSPLVGQRVQFQAVVTALTENDDLLNGFYIQEEDLQVDGDLNTSEGVFVFCDDNCPAGLAVGDLATVTGDAVEFNGSTQVVTGSTGSVVIDSSGNTLPTAALLSLPAATGTDQEATFESTEGMIVSFTTQLTVSEYFQLARFGEVVLTSDGRPAQFTDENAPSAAGLTAYEAELAKRRIILDDNTTSSNDATSDLFFNEPYPYPTPGLSTTNFFRGGDTVTGLTGALEWAFGQWRLRPIDGMDYTFDPANPRPATPDDVGGSLKIASFNVLNYFSTVDSGAAICAPSGDQGCRGADSAAELVRQRDKIVSAMAAIDADVLGLIEVQNDAGASVDELVDGLNAAVGAGTYAALATGFIGTDAIKVAFIYKPATVEATGAFAILDSSVDPDFLDTKNRPVLIQTFTELATGEVVTVAVNHLKSKGSNCNDVSDPDLNDGQGNCNLTRTAAAQALADYLATDPTGSGDPDFLIIGDLNAYAMEDPITALTNSGYTDLVDQFQADAYSFVFDGQIGYLDHALANADLASQVSGTTIWHINADEISLLDYNDTIQDTSEQSFERKSTALNLFEPDPYRSSDHDPVIVGLSLDDGVEPGPTCNGLPATIVGTEGNDNLIGTSGPDVIVGLGGRDLIRGLNGDDVICGGDGLDRLFGGNGDDMIFGDDGNDRIYGEGGYDKAYGGDGRDILIGGTNDDMLFGEGDNDRIYGSAGNDMAEGGPGNDTMVGSAGDDTMSGGADNDVLNGGAGADNLSGDEGDDRVLGGSGDDFLDGGPDRDRLIGSSGFDTCQNGELVATCEA